MKKPFYKNNFITVFKDSENKYRVWINGTAIVSVYNRQQINELLHR